MGIYIAMKNSTSLKKMFHSSDYTPVYYGKSFSNTSANYTPVYLKKVDLTPGDSNNISKSIDTSVIVGKDKKFVEEVKDKNPIDDEYDMFISTIQEESGDGGVEDGYIDISDFVKFPYNYTSKKISGKLILLRGEKSSPPRFYFLYSFDKKYAYYIDIVDENKIVKDFNSFKIGYYYKVSFVSGEGNLKSGNKLISIEETGEKEEWASGLNAF